MSKEVTTPNMLEKTEKGIKRCAEWLVYCLKIGYKRKQLDALEDIFWKFKDGNGNLIKNKTS